MKDKIQDECITNLVLQGMIEKLDIKQKVELSIYIMTKYEESI